MLAKSSNIFLFLVFSFLLLFSSLVGKAQNNSAVNLAGTAWDTGRVVLPLPNSTYSTTTRRRLYDFATQGEVKSAVLLEKSTGGENKYVEECTYNPALGRDDCRMVLKFVPTMPASQSKISNGIYKITGKSIYLDFPDYTVSATIYKDSIKGVLTYKADKEKETWLVTPLESNPDNSSSGNSQNNKSATPTNNPIIGKWKYENECVKYTQSFTSCNRTSYIIYSPDGNVQTLHFIDNTPQYPVIVGNWKYTAEDGSSGVLEEFKDGKLVEKGSVKFLSNSQFQYTITFSSSSDVVGKTYIWNKQ